MPELRTPGDLSPRLEGKVALVTGAGRGIRACIARHLTGAGAQVWVTDKDAATAAATARSLGATSLTLDVRSRADFALAAEQLRAAHGRLDLLVNNAGVITSGAFDATTAEAWTELIDVNVGGIYNGVQALVPLMGRGGAIVNLASVSAARGGGAVGNLWYGASKAAVVAITTGLARELGPRGLRVNAVAPALVDTDMTHALLTAELKAKLAPRFPLGRWIDPDDVARLVTLLCSDSAACITGATVPVDAGFLST